MAGGRVVWQERGLVSKETGKKDWAAVREDREIGKRVGRQHRRAGAGSAGQKAVMYDWVARKEVVG